jgi:hypothetical protein
MAGEAPVDITFDLYKASCADSVHDFKIDNTIPTNTKSGVPCLADVIIALPTLRPGSKLISVPDEDTLLESLLGKSIKDIIEKLRGENVEEYLNINGIKKKEYRVKILKHENEPNIRNIKEKMTIEEYRKFFDLSISDSLNLVIDAQTVGINDLFSYARQERGKEPLEVNSLLNREVINDPGPKSYDQSSFRSNESSKYFIRKETQTGNITYTAYNDTQQPSDLYRNMFFSKLDLCLSPLNDNPGKIPNIKLDIIDQEKEIIHQSSNPHITNAITSCYNFIMGLLTSKVAKCHIKTSAIFQCKRSGDWLQALSCLDTGRQYSDGRAFSNIKLVTHDRILLWYALYIGIDVIFTCSTQPASGAKGSPEYNAAVQKAKREGKYSEDVSSIVDEDDNDTGEDKYGIRRQKILLYFTSSNETPEEKLERLIKTAEKYRTPEYLEGVNKYKAEYNQWILNIIYEIDDYITKTNIIIKTELQKMKSKLISDKLITNTRELISGYWKYTAIHYVAITIPEYPTLLEGEDIENIKLLDMFISGNIAIDNIRTTIKSQEDLSYKSSAYNQSEEYKNIIGMFEQYRPRASRGKVDMTKTPEVLVFKLCNYLQFRLPDVYIKKLLEQLSYIIKELSMKTVDVEKLTLYYLVDLFKKVEVEEIKGLVIDCLKWSAANMLSDNKLIGKHEAVGGIPDEEDTVESQADIMSASQAGEEAVVKKNEEVVDSLLEDGEIPDDILNQDEIKTILKKREILKENGTIALPVNKKPSPALVVLADLASKSEPAPPPRPAPLDLAGLADLASRVLLAKKAPRIKETERKRAYAIVINVNEYSNHIDDMINNLRIDLLEGGGETIHLTYMAYLSYLYTLMNALNGFDTDDGTDYCYYDGLVRLILSSIHKIRNDYDSLLTLSYITIPNDDWDLDGILFKSKSFKKCITTVSKNIALQSLNRSHGDIPIHFIKPADINILDSASYISQFNEITKRVRTMEFRERKTYLLTKLSTSIQDLVQVRSIPIVSAEHVGHKVNDPPRVELKNTRRLVEVRGGHRKKYKKSPRRKTMRKTRRHK